MADISPACGFGASKGDRQYGARLRRFRPHDLSASVLSLIDRRGTGARIRSEY